MTPNRLRGQATRCHESRRSRRKLSNFEPQTKADSAESLSTARLGFMRSREFVCFVTDNFGDSLFIASPGRVPCTHHDLRQYSPGDALMIGRSVAGLFVCLCCGNEYATPVSDDKCLEKLEFVTSGFGSKERADKSRSGLYTWLSTDEMRPNG